MSAVDKFPILLSDAEEESSAVPPCFSDEGINYLYIRHNNLYLLALTKRNSNAAEILLFLHKIVEVFTEYFKELEEESIRDNFVVIYELLDEMMDFGHPQTTESKILQEYITQESHKLEVQARPPIAVTNAVSWRSEGIRYRKNEVFLDVVESLNLLVSSTGNVLRSEILGAIKMKCYLSGMPELRLGLNDKAMFETTGRATRGKAVEMEDVKFHQCVRLSRFENDRTISFIPPDGEFELMSYRLNTQVKPLIWVECIVENHSGSRIEYMLKAKAQFKRRSTANNVEISIPVPEDADTPRFRTNIGSVHYAPEQSAIVWKIKQFGGGKEFLMRAELGLPSVRGDDEKGGGMMGGFGGSMGGVGDRGKGKRPINVKFEVCLVPLLLSLTLTDSYTDPVLYHIRHQRQVSQDHRTQGKNDVLKNPKQTLTTFYSYNTLPSRGSATLHNPATLPFVYQTRNHDDNTIMKTSSKPIIDMLFEHKIPVICLTSGPHILLLTLTVLK
jgi:AP-1 complex subunit mu